MLRGLKVVELAPLFPGPYAGRMLLDMGATVVKVTPPSHKSADLLHCAAMRVAASDSAGADGALSADGAYAAMYRVLNDGKQVVEVDLTSATEATEFVSDHVRGADVLITGYRPGSLDKVGLSPLALRKAFPALVICVISGYGLSGPHSQRAGHDLNYLARNGVLAMQLPRSGGGMPASTPALSPLPVQVADIAGGSYPALINILGGVFHAKQHPTESLDGFAGGGGVYDVSMADCSQSMLVLSQTAHAYSGGLLEVDSGAFHLCGSAPCYNVYLCRDGRFLAVGALEPLYWQRVVQTMGLPPDFVAPAKQLGLGLTPSELLSVFKTIGDTVASRSLAEWVTAFDGVDAMVDPVLLPDEALQSEHAQQRRSAIRSSWSDAQQKLAKRWPLVPPTALALRQWTAVERTSHL